MPFSDTRPAPAMVTASCPPPSMIASPTPWSVTPSVRITIGPAQTPVNAMTGSLPLTSATAAARDFLLQSRG